MSEIITMHKFDVLRQKIKGKICTSYMNTVCRLWGIQQKGATIYIGITYFRKLPKTKIVIGRNCSFRSGNRSNLIGINRNCMVSTLKSDAKIEIGDNCGFSGTVIGAFRYIKLGANVRCGANTLITDSDWHLDDPRCGEPQPVIVEDNVWLGEGVKVLKGVTIGTNTVIGAGSVVAKSIPANVIAAGNPCKVIRSLK